MGALRKLGVAAAAADSEARRAALMSVVAKRPENKARLRAAKRGAGRGLAAGGGRPSRKIRLENGNSCGVLRRRFGQDHGAINPHELPRAAQTRSPFTFPK